MKKMQQNRKLKEQRIQQAAQELFQTNGFIGTSMDKVADKAGVTKQTVYRYFESKEALFKSMLEAQRLQESFDFMKALDLKDPAIALQAFAKGFIEKHLSKNHLANIRLLVSEGPLVPEITRAFYAVGPVRTKSGLAKFFKDRFNIDDAQYEIDVFLSILGSMRMPALMGLAEPPSRETIHRHADKAVNAVFKLLDL